MSTTLADKLLNYQETPPQAAWQAIALSLQHENREFIALADRLQQYEIAPPSQSWTSIAEELQQNNATHKIALIKRFPTLYKVSAVAAVVGIVCLVGFYLSKKTFKSPTAPMAVKSKSNTPKPAPPSLQDIIQETVPVPPLAILNKARVAIKKRKKYFARSEEKILRNAAIDRLSFADTLISIMVNAKLIRNEKGAIIQNINLLNAGDDKYISITSPSGEQTRISSKFLPSLLYLHDNNYLDNFRGYIDRSFLESLAWKLKFQSWRKKLLQTPFIPSSYNYLDIFEFKQLISEAN